jgi:hypothetical protein
MARSYGAAGSVTADYWHGRVFNCRVFSSSARVLIVPGRSVMTATTKDLVQSRSVRSSGELASSGGVKDCLDQQAGVAFVDAGDGPSPRLAGARPARLAARRSIRCSPPGLGSPPASGVLMAASQSMAAVRCRGG